MADRAAVGVLTQVFPVELVDRVIDERERREQRIRRLPSRLVFYFVLALCLFPHESYQSAMKIMMDAFGRRDRAVRVPTAAAIGYARGRLGPECVERISREAMRPMAQPMTRGAWYKTRRLVAFDGTTFTVPDTEDNDRAFGRPGSRQGEGKSAYPQVRAACLVELGTHAVFDARLGRYTSAETTLTEEMFSSLRPGMLAIADRNLYSATRWTKAAATGADLLWRVKNNMILAPVEMLADGSYLTEITPPSRCGLAPFRVRVIEYRLSVEGKEAETYRLITTILDPRSAPAKDLASLYHARWDIEGFFKQIKSNQLNRDKIFRSRSSEGVRQEFWAHLAVHYATTRITVDAAGAGGIDPDRISRVDTIRIIRSRIWKPESFPPDRS